MNQNEINTQLVETMEKVTAQLAREKERINILSEIVANQSEQIKMFSTIISLQQKQIASLEGGRK